MRQRGNATGGFTGQPRPALALRVNAAAGHDTLGTGGTTVLGGTLRALVQPGLSGNVTLYTNVVTAPAGLGGTQFASAVSSSPFFTASAAYGANAVNLTLTRIASPSLATVPPTMAPVPNR